MRPSTTHLTSLTNELFRDGLASSTRNTYSAGQQQFYSFCRFIKCCPVPSTEATLVLFVSHLAEFNIAYATIKVYLAAVRQLYVSTELHVQFSLQGTSLILNTRWIPSSALNLYTDASGMHGWGAYWNGRWIQSHWSSSQNNMDITWKELFAIVVAVHTWVPPGPARKSCFIVTTKPWWTSGTRALLVHLIPWVWFTYCIFVPVVTISMFVSPILLVSAMILLTRCLISRWTSSGSWLPDSKYCPTAYLHGPLKSS